MKGRHDDGTSLLHRAEGREFGCDLAEELSLCTPADVLNGKKKGAAPMIRCLSDELTPMQGVAVRWLRLRPNLLRLSSFVPRKLPAPSLRF